MEFYPGCHLVAKVNANTFLLCDSAGLAVIDCGLAGNAEKILTAVARLGRRPQDVRWIFITHADDDHYGSLHELQKRTRALTWASPLEAEAIRSGGASRALRLHPLPGFIFERLIKPRIRARAARVDEFLSDGQKFPILGGLKAVFTSGHTPGHVSFFLERHGVLFAGDSIRARDGTPAPSSGINTWDEERALHSMREQAMLKPDIVCPGHGAPLSDDPLERWRRGDGI